MDVARYIFKSPYPSQIQVGRLDMSASKEENTQQNSSEIIDSTNESLNNAQSFTATQTQDIEPTVKSDALLDIYA